MSWQTPKTDWAAADGVRDSDFNRIEGNILELYNTSAIYANIVLYVSTAGSDDTGIGTSALPYRTITKALSTLPRNLNGKTVEIIVAAGSYAEDVVISGFNGTILFSPSGAVSIRSIIVDNCVVVNNASSITLNPGTSANGLTLQNNAVWNGSAAIAIESARVGLVVNSGSTFSLLGVLTINNSATGIDVCTGSTAYVSKIEGSGNTEGLTANSGGILMYGSTSIDATVHHSTCNGGRIFSGAQTSISTY